MPIKPDFKREWGSPCGWPRVEMTHKNERHGSTMGTPGPKTTEFQNPQRTNEPLING